MIQTDMNHYPEITSDTFNISPSIVRLSEKFSALPVIREVDRHGFRDTLIGLSAQCLQAWTLGQSWTLPQKLRLPRRVIFAGVGGSAIGADVVATYARLFSPISVEVTRDYSLPPLDKDCLVLACSFSGETEEAIKPFQAAAAAGAMCLAITTGGTLQAEALRLAQPCLTYSWSGTPRSAIGYGVFLPLAILSRLGLFEISDDEIESVIADLMQLSDQWELSMIDDAVTLPALIAGEMLERIPLIVGSGFLEVAARRWAGELAENSKRLAVPVAVPEFNHNLLEGAVADALRYQTNQTSDPWFVILLDASPAHPRNRLRVSITRKHFENAGRKAWHVDVGGKTPLQSIMRACSLGSWVSFYLALFSGVDPTKVDILAQFKRDIALANEGD